MDAGPSTSSTTTPPPNYLTIEAFNEFKTDINARIDSINEQVNGKVTEEVSKARTTIIGIISDIQAGLVETTGQVNSTMQASNDKLEALDQVSKSINQAIE